MPLIYSLSRIQLSHVYIKKKKISYLFCFFWLLTVKAFILGWENDPDRNQWIQGIVHLFQKLEIKQQCQNYLQNLPKEMLNRQV